MIISLVCLIAGVVLFALWFFMHTSARHLVADIKSQMPPNRPIQEEPPEIDA